MGNKEEPGGEIRAEELWSLRLAQFSERFLFSFPRWLYRRKKIQEEADVIQQRASVITTVPTVKKNDVHNSFLSPAVADGVFSA